MRTNSSGDSRLSAAGATIGPLRLEYVSRTAAAASASGSAAHLNGESIERRGQRLVMSVEVLVPENLAMRVADAGEDELQIARFAHAGVRERRGRRPPDHLAPADVRFDHPHLGRVVNVAVQRQRGTVRIPIGLRRQRDVRSGAGDERRRPGRHPLPGHPGDRVRCDPVLRQEKAPDAPVAITRPPRSMNCVSADRSSIVGAPSGSARINVAFASPGRSRGDCSQRVTG